MKRRYTANKTTAILAALLSAVSGTVKSGLRCTGADISCALGHCLDSTDCVMAVTDRPLSLAPEHPKEISNAYKKNDN